MEPNLVEALRDQSNEYKVYRRAGGRSCGDHTSSPLQIIVIGAVAVGKTSLVMRYVHDQFHERMSTLIAEKEKVVTVDGQEVHLKIWDTAGLYHQ